MGTETLSKEVSLQKCDINSRYVTKSRSVSGKESKYKITRTTLRQWRTLRRSGV